MPFKIVRNDITKMACDAIVNTAANEPVNSIDEVGAGCDKAVHLAAGSELLDARKQIGFLADGEAAITPGFNLTARYIIHAVSPIYINGEFDEEAKLRNCYRNSLKLAAEKGLESIAFPLIATGSFGYPKEEAMRIAIDEITAFLMKQDVLVYLVVFGSKATKQGERLYPDLEEYIDLNYVQEKNLVEYGDRFFGHELEDIKQGSKRNKSYDDEITELQDGLAQKLEHSADTFSQYLFFLIEKKQLKNSDVYSRALVDRKVFSKIKQDVNYHPNKRTALCLCVGAELTLSESRELLARAGYALSPCDKTDIIFSYFIENGHYNMLDLDIELEEHGLPCIIS